MPAAAVVARNRRRDGWFMTKLSRERDRVGSDQGRSDQPDAPGEARGLRRSRRDSGDGNRATARGRDKSHREAMRKPQRPSPWLRPPMRSAGRKKNRRWRCNRLRHGLHRHRRHNLAPQSRPRPQMQFHAKAMLPMRNGHPSEHERDLTWKRPIQAAGPTSASSATSKDADPFCAAMYSPATCDTLPSLTDFERLSM